ncbi:unnamed protein product [Adineta steineri]|uniref:PPPDE domain-containing protein n=1 Tax=Adineta steineri TaxID=433720 RepID=A0A818T233_9BILA|nr:unnamed protein product [Adineta steineri]CAF3677661.1 unnamed protein product [Adineta steineri]
MGNGPPKVVNNPDDSPIEVYIVLKKRDGDSYTWDDSVSHHICLLKQPNGKFYYTALFSADGGRKSEKGRLTTRFGEYQFYSTRPIYYRRVGCTRKTLAEIEEFAKKSPFNDTDYNLIFQTCQRYVESCIKFLAIEDPASTSETVAGPKATDTHDKVYTALSASDPSDIRLND